MDSSHSHYERLENYFRKQKLLPNTKAVDATMNLYEESNLKGTQADQTTWHWRSWHFNIAGVLFSFHLFVWYNLRNCDLNYLFLFWLFRFERCASHRKYPTLVLSTMSSTFLLSKHHSHERLEPRHCLMCKCVQIKHDVWKFTIWPPWNFQLWEKIVS